MPFEAFGKGIPSMHATTIVQAAMQAWEEHDAKQILPQSIGKAQLLAFMKAITTAFSDWSFNGHVLLEKSLAEHSWRVLFVTAVTDTQAADLILPPLPVIPATGTKIALPYRHLEFLVTGDAITAITADFSPSGLEEVLAQLGLELP